MAKTPAKTKKPALDMRETPTSEYKMDDVPGFLKEARERAVYGYGRWSHNFEQAREDLHFLNGKQWADSDINERKARKSPFLTFNDLPQFVDQVLGDERQNRPSIQVSASDGVAGTTEIEDMKGKKIATAEVLEGLIRNVEYRSKAEAQYDTAGQHAVEGGFGWLRVLTEFDNPKSFDVQARIRSIPNRFAVVLDPDCDEPDMSDAKWGFIADRMERTHFNKMYPDASQGSLLDTERGYWGDVDGRFITVAEYYWREPTRRKLLQMTNGMVHWEDEVKDVLDELAAAGITVVQSRKVDTYCVYWAKISAHSILRKPVKVPCSYVPIVPVLGKEINIDGNRIFRGMIRHAKDPKRAENFWLTAATERVALSPKAPWLATADQVKGREDTWKTANTGNPSVLIYNDVPGQAPPKRQDPATMPVAELQMAGTMTDKVKSTIGMYSASLGAQSNETSGRAILARQREADVGSFAFIDNQARAIAQIGRILVEMLPAIYDTEREVVARGPDGKVSNTFTLNRTVKDEQTGKNVVVNDIGLGSYDVVVRTGPSYTTQREEAAEALMEFMRVAPSVATLIVDKVAEVMDWPGAQEISRRLRRTIPRNILTEQEIEELGDEASNTPEPTPEQQAELAKAQADMAQAEATMAMAQAKTAEAEAKMAEIRAGAQNNEFMAQVKQMIEEALATALSEIVQ